MKTPARDVVPVKTKWTTLVSVCGECKRGKALQKSLRTAVKERRERGLRIVRTTCLDVCPKGGVTLGVASAAGLRTLVVRDGHDVAAVLDALTAPVVQAAQTGSA